MRRSYHILVILILLNLPPIAGNACLIMFFTDGQRMLVGNHEDWFANDAGVKINPPTPGVYGSVIFTFMNEGWAQGGMNEHGLFFDGAYTPFQDIDFDVSKMDHPGYVWQEMLDKTRNVDEALVFLSKFKLPELSEAHIFLADASGKAVVIGVENGGIQVLEREDPYLIQTNFNPWHPELSEESVCHRYETTKSILTSASNQGSSQMVKEVLESTHQDSLTVYSNIYDLTNKSITTYYRRHFDKPIEITLDQIFSYGDCMISLEDLENDHLAFEQCAESNASEVIMSGVLVNSESEEPIPYANIGIPGINLGTLSDPDGSFVLKVPREFQNDTIQFSSIGYESIAIVANGHQEGRLEMVETGVMLDEIVVNKKRRKVARLGIMGGKDGILPFDTIQGGGAVALLLEAPDDNLYVTKLQLRLLYNSKDTSRFRLHFYEYDPDTRLPGKEILAEEIMLEESRRFGWMRWDLRDHDIYLPQSKFFVGFEWIETRESREQFLAGMQDYHNWKKNEYENGNLKVEFIASSEDSASTDKGRYKYHGNMMNWPGFHDLPPWTGLMIKTGKDEETKDMLTYQRKTSFGKWEEVNATLNAIVVVSY